MRLAVWVLAVIATGLAFYVLSRDLMPPQTLSFAAGPEGGGYHAFARRYQDILARDGIEVEILTTAGSLENVALLDSGRAQVALLQGGIVPETPAETLGSVFLEPIFFFARTDSNLSRNPALWRGLTIATGGIGSGTHAAFEDFVRASGQDPGANTHLPIGGDTAAQALLDGEVDVAAFVAPISAAYLQDLFAAPDISIMRLDHIKALGRRLPQSSLIVLPSGSYSLNPPIPQRDLEMLALVAWLVAPEGLHPSLVDRLVIAAREIHGRRDAVTGDGDFPNMAFATLPPDTYARDLIASGPSRLGDYLPYWMVAQVSRFAILLVPVLFLLVPLIRALPSLYAWQMRRRVFRHYAKIREIDTAALDTADPADLRVLSDRLEAIDFELGNLSLPLPYRDFAFTARVHIDLVRKRIAESLGREAV